jgi:hypothetical protein
MKNIMEVKIVVTPVYSNAELRDRANFHQFVDSFFIMKKVDTGDFPKGLSTQFFFSMFDAFVSGSHVLNESIVESLMLMGGFTEDVENNIWCSVKMETFSALPQSVQLRLATMADTKIALTMRQKILGIDTTASISSKEQYLKVFIRQYVFTQNHNNFYTLNTLYGKTTLKDVYDYYQMFCNMYSVPVLSKSDVRKYLEDWGYGVFKGYSKGQSGIMLIRKMFVPVLESDLELTRELFTGVCTLPGGTQVTVGGLKLHDLTIEGKSTLIASNKEESGYVPESRAKENEGKAEEAETAETVDRTKIETTKANVGSGSKTSKPKKSTRDNEGRVKKHEKANKGLDGDGGHSISPDNVELVSTEVQDSRSPGIAYPNSDTILESQDADSWSSNISTPEIRYADFPEPELHTGGIPDSGVGSIEEDGGSTEPIAEEEPTIRDIAIALHVPYKMNYGGVFDAEKMQHYLDTMHIDLPAEDYYDSIMEIITELEGGVMQCQSQKREK